jgi:hypothetical protein
LDWGPSIPYNLTGQLNLHPRAASAPDAMAFRDGRNVLGRPTITWPSTTRWSQSRKAEHPEWGFPGLRPGDRWCLCVARWKEALDAGCAPPVILRATHAAALDVVTLADLQAHAAG